MLAALASVLLLGIVPMHPAAPPTRSLPGIEVMSVSAPNSIIKKFEAPLLSASGVLLIDALSGEEIYSISKEQRRPMASLTKIMTALMILERHDLDETVVVPPMAEQIGGSTVGIKPGQRLSVGSMLKALLLPSANDVAYTLAMFSGKSVGTFVSQMNDRALALGLKNTHFANPAGLDNAMQYSTPRDLAWLTLAALQHESFREMVGTRSARIVASDGTEFDLRNTNEMLHFNEQVLGVKTGTTDGAGECLIVLFREKESLYLLILLDSKDRYTDGLRMLQAVHTASQ